MSKITGIYERLVAEARRGDRDASIALAGGVRLVVRVEPLGEADDQYTLTIARAKARPSDQEIRVFRRDCGVPPAALVWPHDGVPQRIERAGGFWYVLTLRWARPIVEAAPSEAVQEEAAL
jgi:hypothetical protein